ncbi:MAG TPA: hypothetical protein VGF55_09600, partial [Gemmataceae bacterium]
MAVHVLALFDWVEGLWETAANTAVRQDIVNFRAKNKNATGLVFANYGTNEAKKLQANVLEAKPAAPKSGVDLAKVGAGDKLVIFGHGDNAKQEFGGYNSSRLGTDLVMWNLTAVDTIYLCGCEMGLGNFPRDLGMALSGVVTWKSIRAPKGFVKIGADGRKQVFWNEDGTDPVAKGRNKAAVAPKDCV